MSIIKINQVDVTEYYGGLEIKQPTTQIKAEVEK
jgi:hypothetical protein